ncbi:MAG: MBL fold metallo-hydrolase [Rhodospirillales bacterium]|nr:MBL fold metallo-hydrolase [Rhodospirillales bacterium]
MKRLAASVAAAALVAGLAAGLGAQPVGAQSLAQSLAQAQPNAERGAAPCGLGFVRHERGLPGLLHRATASGGASGGAPAGHVKLTFSGHSTFLIETAQGVKAVTDYNDFVRPDVLPDLITMNTGHSTHSTDNVDPAIKHVLRGWNPSGVGVVRHNVREKDLRVFNLPTNIDAGYFGSSSIFVFEAAGVCIAHFGNIRHALDDDRVRRMGRIDIMLVPVDRWITASFDEILFNIDKLKPRYVIPMHYNFMDRPLEFAERVKGMYKTRLNNSPSITVSRASMPVDTEVLVLPLPGWGG